MANTDVAGIERRGHSRVSIELRCSYPASGKRPRVTVGHTANISRSGVLVLWDGAAALPLLGEVVSLEVELPPSQNSCKRLRCRGRVVRIHVVHNQPAQVAVAIERIYFKDGEAPMVVVSSNRKIEQVLE